MKAMAAGMLALSFLSGEEAEANTTPASWKAGVARTHITPSRALWMGGYGKRTRPAEGKETDLWLKALALEDTAGHRAVIVTSDLLAIRPPLYQACLPRLKERFGLEPAQILLTASHTHCGPFVPVRPEAVLALEEAQHPLISEYCRELETKLVETVGQALAGLSPARLATGEARTGFAVNRRNNHEAEIPRRIQQGTRAGPVDHSVPVLAVSQPDGMLLAVLFGYACHNTTLDFYQWCGDYAGYAQMALERSHPGAQAMFFMGCGADQNPLPRGGLALARRYGNLLAAAVEEALLRPPTPLAPTLKTTMETIRLNLGAAPTEAELEKLKDDEAACLRRWAASLLADLKAGRPLARTCPYPVQVWRLGGRQTLITLGGEPVVDYVLKFKREFGPQTWVAGYANSVMAYIPSRRVLDEDKPPLARPTYGYEGYRAMVVLGLSAWCWAEDVEDLVTASVRRLVEQAGE